MLLSYVARLCSPRSPLVLFPSPCSEILLPPTHPRSLLHCLSPPELCTPHSPRRLLALLQSPSGVSSRARPRTSGLCDNPGTAPPLQRTHRSHTLPPTGAVRLSASSAWRSFLPLHVCPESSSFHAACLHTFTVRLLYRSSYFTAPTLPRVRRKHDPSAVQEAAEPNSRLAPALPCQGWHGCHSLLLARPCFAVWSSAKSESEPSQPTLLNLKLLVPLKPCAVSSFDRFSSCILYAHTVSGRFLQYRSILHTSKSTRVIFGDPQSLSKSQTS
jgi:hypothetical protein